MEARAEGVVAIEDVILTRSRGDAEKDAESFEMKDKPKPENTETAEIRPVVENVLTDQIIGCAIEVHRHLGPGLLESVYEECLCYELSQLGLRFERQVHLPVTYKGIRLECGHKLDLVVEDSVVVELKAIDELAPIHQAQLLTYLKTSNKKVGLLINFNVQYLKNGLKRVVNRYAGPALKPQISAVSVFEPLSSSPRLSPRLRDSASSSSLQAGEPLAPKDPR
jgi:GxxExxY protein